MVKKIGVPEERIIRLEGNFWDIGEGPSGPNTEIFYDRGEDYGNDPSDPELYPGGENERYLEVWNLVFSEFNHNPDGTYTPLPKKNIDTGMGLERMVSVIQDAKTNYDTDLFMPIIKATEAISGEKYGTSAEKDTAFKVVADHIRTAAFAVGDGALPSNEGRGYVIRRLLRRAVRYAKSININRPFMYELVPVVADIMAAFYGEVKEKADFIAKVIKTEEERFHETLHEGLAILSEVIQKEKAKGNRIISGEDVFKLYDTYGFPVELTEEYAEDEGMEVDHDGFEREMDKQRERARQARQDVGSMQVQGGALRDIMTKANSSAIPISKRKRKSPSFFKTGNLPTSFKKARKFSLSWKKPRSMLKAAGKSVIEAGLKAGMPRFASQMLKKRRTARTCMKGSWKAAQLKRHERDRRSHGAAKKRHRQKPYRDTFASSGAERCARYACQPGRLASH